MLNLVRGIPIMGQFVDCKPQHYSAALLEFGFVCLASLLPIMVVTLLDVSAGQINTFDQWSARFAPELAIASSCMIAPIMYFFVTPSKPNGDGERTDYPHKGSLQLLSIAIFSLGMILYVILACTRFFSPEIALSVTGTLFGLGVWLYIPALFLSYTALLFRNFANNPVLQGPDIEVPDILDQLQGRVQ